MTLDHYARWSFSDIAQALQADLAEIGIRLTLLAGEAGQVTTKSRARQHDMILEIWGGASTDPSYNAPAFCVNLDNSDESAQKSIAWRSNFFDETLSKEVVAAAKILDTGTHAAAYDKIQRDFRGGKARDCHDRVP